MKVLFSSMYIVAGAKFGLAMTTLVESQRVKTSMIVSWILHSRSLLTALSYQVRHPGQSRWLDEYGRLKGGQSYDVSLCQCVLTLALLKASLLVCILLVTNVDAHLFQLKAHCRDGIPSCPEVFAREVALSSTKLTSNDNGTFSL